MGGNQFQGHVACLMRVKDRWRIGKSVRRLFGSAILPCHGEFQNTRARPFGDEENSARFDRVAIEAKLKLFWNAAKRDRALLKGLPRKVDAGVLDLEAPIYRRDLIFSHCPRRLIPWHLETRRRVCCCQTLVKYEEATIISRQF